MRVGEEEEEVHGEVEDDESDEANKVYSREENSTGGEVEEVEEDEEEEWEDEEQWEEEEDVNYEGDEECVEVIQNEVEDNGDKVDEEIGDYNGR